uniref:Uncharacterized protein n=1 Tax=Ditylenchus dipsaci TaxID=166011 RepID=A0A915DAE0_9BILA
MNVKNNLKPPRTVRGIVSSATQLIAEQFELTRPVHHNEQSGTNYEKISIDTQRRLSVKEFYCWLTVEKNYERKSRGGIKQCEIQNFGNLAKNVLLGPSKVKRGFNNSRLKKGTKEKDA